MPRPFKALPNVSEAKIVTSQLDPLLARGGIARRLKPETDFKELSSKIKATNRYIVMFQNKLERMLRNNQPVHFWVYALLLMKRSRALRLVALRKLEPNWHRIMKLGLVKGILTRLNLSILSLKTDLFIVRDYVAKTKPNGDKTWRPVGAPSYPDRMYTYLLQSFIVMFVKGWLSPHQHGFLPGRGVNTAIEDLTSYLENPVYKYAYEFDLKGAFPSVYIPQVIKVLKEIGFPPALVDLLEDISLSTVERVDLAPADKQGSIPEPKFEKQKLLAPAVELVMPSYEGGMRPTYQTQDRLNELFQFIMFGTPTRYGPSPDSLPYLFSTQDEKQFRDMLYIAYNRHVESGVIKGPILYSIPDKPRPWPLPDNSVIERTQESVPGEQFPGWKITIPGPASFTEPKAAEQRVLHSKMLGAKGKVAIEAQGFPQGLGISPILFDVAFDYALIKNHFAKLDKDAVVVAYADDFLVFSPNPLVKEKISTSPDMEAMGLKFSWEKSRPIKADGLWLVSAFKFLGITFKFPAPDSPDIIVQGTPRSGAILDYDKGFTVDKFIERDNSLRRFAAALDLDESPQELLDQWGMGIHPGASVPLDIVQGKTSLSHDQAMALAGKPLPEGGPKAIAPWAETVIKSVKSEPEVPSYTSGPGQAKHLLGPDKPLKGLRSRLKGLLINRLHGGSWEAKFDKPLDRSLKPKGSAPEGTTWIERIQHLTVRTPSLSHITHASKLRVAARLEALSERARSLSIYNSTSHATLDLMNWQRNPRSLKTMRRGLRYS